MKIRAFTVFQLIIPEELGVMTAQKGLAKLLKRFILSSTYCMRVPVHYNYAIISSCLNAASFNMCFITFVL